MERLTLCTSSTVPTADAGLFGTEISHEHVPDEIAESRPPGDTALTELEFLDQLFNWATNMRNHPEAFFTEAELSEIEPPTEKVPDEVSPYIDPYGVRAQEDLDVFRKLLYWAETWSDKMKRMNRSSRIKVDLVGQVRTN